MIINKDELFRKKTNFLWLDGLLKEAKLKDRAIVLTIKNENSFDIDLDNKDNKTKLLGTLKVENLENSSKNLFFPFLVNILSITLSTKNIYYYPNYYRSVADFFMRNLATSYITKQNIYFMNISSNRYDTVEKELQKILFWDYKKAFGNFSDIKKVNLDFNKFYFAPLFSGIDFGINLLNSYQHEINSEIISVREKNYCSIITEQLLDEREKLSKLKFGF